MQKYIKEEVNPRSAQHDNAAFYDPFLNVSTYDVNLEGKSSVVYY